MKRRIVIFLTACILVLSMCLNPVMAAASEDGSGETEETSAEEEQSADKIAAGRFFDAVRAIVLAKAGEGKSKTTPCTGAATAFPGIQIPRAVHPEIPQVAPQATLQVTHRGARRMPARVRVLLPEMGRTPDRPSMSWKRIKKR